MKKSLLTAVCCLLCAAAAYSQSRETFIENYSRQVSRLGYDGVGVEGILDKWEAAFPEDGLMMEARYAYYLEKCRSSQVIPLDRTKYLGNKPLLSLPDSSGNTVRYFQDYVYDESLFSQALGWIDKAIARYPDECSYSFDKVSALLEYEKESPDLALEMLVDMVTVHYSEPGWWKSEGIVVDVDSFVAAIQEYCFKFYSIGSKASYEAFLALSQEMNSIYPDNPDFLTNIGTYWLIARDNDRKALSYYRKALKINHEDQTAIANIKVIERRAAAKKTKK